jgi:hypothetical protein
MEECVVWVDGPERVRRVPGYEDWSVSETLNLWHKVKAGENVLNTLVAKLMGPVLRVYGAYDIPLPVLDALIERKKENEHVRRQDA